MSGTAENHARQRSQRFPFQTGFTVIELLVVISISVFLMGFLIISAGRGRQQTETYAEGAQIMQAVFRAKSDTVAMLSAGNDIPCGYGLRVDYSARTYGIFKYDPPQGTSCNYDALTSNDLANADSVAYLPGQTFTLNNDSRIDGSSGDSMQYVLFLPPQPKVLIWHQGDIMPQGNSLGKIHLASQDQKTKLAITVNAYGQVTMVNEAQNP